MNNTLLIGSKGLLGNFLTSYLREMNISVVELFRPKQTDEFEKRCIQNNKSIELDLLRTTTREIDDLIKQYQITSVINCAGVLTPHTMDDFLSNAYLLNALYASTQSKHIYFIQFGSMSEYSLQYADLHTTIDEYYSCNPVGNYGISKLFGTCLAHFYSDSVKTITLRLSNVIGPTLNNRTLIGAMLSELERTDAEKNGVTLQNNINTRDFIDIRDVSALVYKLITNDTKVTGIYNVGSGVTVNYLELVELFNTISSQFGLAPVMSTSDFSMKPIQFKKYDSSKLSKALNWKPTYTLADSLNWCIKERICRKKLQ